MLLDLVKSKIQHQVTRYVPDLQFKMYESLFLTGLYLCQLINCDIFKVFWCVAACLHSWLSALESTKWLQHLSLLLKAALLVVNAADRDHRPVLVHCSDGWDRTPQIVALSKLLLDPYYRTIEVSTTL